MVEGGNVEERAPREATLFQIVNSHVTAWINHSIRTYRDIRHLFSIQYPPELSVHLTFLHGRKGKYACCAIIFIKSISQHHVVCSIDLIVIYNLYFLQRAKELIDRHQLSAQSL